MVRARGRGEAIRGGVVAVVALLSLSSLSGLSGCYSYARSSADDAPVGASVRVRLAPDEADRVGGVLGRDDRSVEGELMARTDSGGLLIKVPTSSISDGATFGETHQRISVSRSGVQDVEVRTLDRTRTGGLLAIGAAAAVYVAVSAFDAATKSPNQGPDRGGTNASRRPLVRVRIPF